MAQNIIATADRPKEIWPYDNPDNSIGTRYVLTRGIVGDVAVYQGPDVWDEWHVAAQGDKISREDAEKLFGDLITPDVIYRR